MSMYLHSHTSGPSNFSIRRVYHVRIFCSHSIVKFSSRNRMCHRLFRATWITRLWLCVHNFDFFTARICTYKRIGAHKTIDTDDNEWQQQGRTRKWKEQIDAERKKNGRFFMRKFVRWSGDGAVYFVCVIIVIISFRATETLIQTSPNREKNKNPSE